MKTTYTYAKEKNQKFVACIPTFYDKLNESCLEEIIKEGCDYVQLMNYEKANMIENCFILIKVSMILVIDDIHIQFVLLGMSKSEFELVGV